MEDASEDTARLSVAATALVHVIGDCDMVLQLRDVTLKESDPNSPSMRTAPESARAAALLERQPLRFSFQDGVVEELCPSEGEELWALNVKRGVLSAFQNGMTGLDSDQIVTEVDVAGTCPSQYHVINKGWYSTTVKRSKDLLACTGRHDYQTALQASSYHVQSDVQSLPLMKSTHQCEQTVDQYGILSSATCTENHQFRPFSREASGAVTKVSQSLKYKSQTGSRPTIHPVSQRVSLMYQHANEDITRKALQEVEEVLRQLCRDTQTDIRPDTPRLFSSLVSAMRRVDTSGLKALYAKLEQNTLCADNIRPRKFFVDALPMAGTEATVTMMTQMLMNNDVTGVEADMWLTSLALIQEPSAAMLEQVKSLLKSQTLGEKALLPVSTMINNFCQRQPQCSLESSVQSIMTSFEDLIGSSCYVNKKNLDQVLMGLRAIGNAGHVSSAVSVVNKCVKRTRNPTEVRVAAAQAFRRLPCDADRTAVTFLMEDTQEDSELRIAAYLAVMTCPDDDTLQRVQLLLESETDEQVGSFVWSHLTNLQETSSPHKQAVRQLLKNVQLPAKFNLGRLQFSRNYEGSAFLKRLNSGAAAEGNLVWSSSSSLPRSASANLTVDLFGRSLNLLDVGLRLEGLEYLMETLLGPYGYFAQEGKEKKSDQHLDELKGSLYVRMFGNEMAFQRFQGLDSLTSSSSFNMLDFLIKLSKNHDISMTHSMEFLDTQMTVPTSCGLPLSLTVKGTATVDLKASGKVDLRKVSSTPRSLQIDGEIRPSGAIRVSGQMSVDAQVSRAALHVTGTLHSSTALKARVDLDRGRVLSMELDVPEDKMEIFDISSEFSIVHNTVEKKQKMITENRKTVKVCTGELASRITGLELCGELQYPNASTRVSGPYFPFTGPTSLSLALYKRDTHTSYKLLAKRVENKKKTMAQLSFNTPGSKVDRSLAFDLVLNHEDKQLEVSAASPWKKAEFKGAITNTKKLMGVSGSFVTDDVNVYSMRTEVKIDESKNGVTYTPVVELRHPSRDNVALTGMVSMESKSAVADLTLTGVTALPLTFKSTMTNTKKEVSLAGSVAKGDKQQYSLRVGSQMSSSKNKMQVTPFLSVKSPKRELVSFSGSGLYTQDKILKTDFILRLLSFKPVSAQFTATKSARKTAVRYISKVNVKSAVVSSSMSATVNVKKGRLANGRVNVMYNVPRVVKDKIVIMAKLTDRSTKAYNKYTVRSSVDSKSFPDYNTAIKLNLDHKKKLSSGELEVNYGRNLKDKTKRVSVSATLARKIKNLKNMDLNFKMSAQAPQQDIDMKLRGKHSHDSNGVDSNAVLTYAKGKDVSAALTLKDKSSKLKKVNGELTLKAPGTGFTLKSGLTQASKKQWEHNLSLKTKGSMHSINTVYKNRGSSSHEVSSTVGVDGIKPVVLSGEANLEWDDLQLAGSVKQGKNTYGVSGTHKLAKSQNGRWSLEVTVPSRRVVLNADAGKVKGNYEGSLEAAWDADNDKNAKVVIEGMAGSKSSKDYSSHKARVSLSTPVQGYSNLAVSVGLDSSSSQHQLSTKLVMGDKKNVITTSLIVAKPLTPRDIDVAFKAQTPFRGYGSMGLTFTHKLDTGLRTKLVLSLQKDQCEVSLTAKNRGTDGSRDLQAQLDVKSSLRKISLKSLSVSAVHKDDGRQFSNQVDVKVNKQAYSYLMNMKVDTGSSTGDITVTWPKEQMKTTWTHLHTPSDLTSSLTTVWGADKRVKVDVTGARAAGSLSGSVALQTPWRNARDWRAELSTQYGTGSLLSSSSVKNENREAFTHNVILTADASKTDLDFSLTSPWTEPISSKVNAKYESFPMSANAEFSWEPRKKVTAEGSVIINNWDDLDITMRVTTPVRSVRSLAAQVSSKAEGSEVVSQLNMDLGMRKNVILTTRVQRDLSGARVKLSTPWDELRVVDTGVETSIQSAAGKVKADFKAVPVIGQYEASATWNAEDDLNARLRLDTPRDDFPYLQIVASSKDKRRVRQSRVELEYSPRQTYSLDTTYSFDVPLVLDVNVATPLSGYESLSASFRHNMRDTAMDASAQVIYTNDKAIKATAMMDWSRGLDSSVTVTTPFSGWEKSSAILRHEGEWNDFNSLADVSVAGQGLTSSLKFLHKMKTEGQLSISTPWAGWEQIEAAISRKGDLSNLRGTATVVYSGQKMEANVVNKWNSRKARLVASLSTPYTQDIKLNFEQSADLQTEASLSYGREYSVDTSSSAVFNSREVSASTSIKYRVGGPRHLVTASFAKVGSLQDLALTASTSLDKQEVSLTAELNTVRDIKAAVALRTPFSQFESLGASFQHSGDLNQMTTEANVQYMTDKNVNGKLELAIPSLNQISIRGTFTSPLSGLERSVVSLSHTAGPKMCTGSFNLETTIADFGSLDASYQRTGHVNNMKAESHVTYNSQSLLDVNLAHRLSSDRLRSSLRVLTSVLPELNIDVNHQGDIHRFTTKASASAGEDKVSSDTQWSMSEDNMDLSQALSSNVQGEANKAAIVLSRVGPLTDVTLQLSGNVNADKAKIVGRLATVRDLSASLEVESPFDGYRQLGASFQKTGDSSDLSVTAAANVERQKIEVVSKYNQDNQVKGSIEITTPFRGYKQMGAAFNYGGETAMISGNLQNDKIEATGRFVNDDITEGNVEIMTPFAGYKQMGASFNYGGNSITATANVQNEKVEAIAKYDTDGDITGSVEVMTPFTGYTQLGGQFRYAGDMSDVTMVTSLNVEDIKMEVTAKFNKGQDVTGSVEMITPFIAYRTMGSSFALTGDMEAIQQGGDLSLLLAAHLMQDKVEARAAFSNREALSGSVTMATPFEGFNQVGATFKHTGGADNFNTEGQVTYMDGQTISGKVSHYNYRLRRIETSAELRTPFTNWGLTKLSYKHAGNTNKFECNAKLECGRGHQHTADLKVDLRRDQNVQLTVKTPYDGFRMTELIHSLSHSDSSVQWSGAVTYGQAQRASSQLTVSYPDDRFSSRFDLQTPFTSDLTATFDHQGTSTSFTRKQTIKYGEQFQYSDDLEFQLNDSPLLLVNEVITYSYGDVSKTQSVYLRREGPWSDVTLAAKGALNGQEATVDAAFKNEFGRMEGSVKINTPLEGYSDVGASFQHIGELSSTFNTEAKVEYTDGQEVAGKLDFMRASWRRLEVTAELTTPFEDWTQTRAEYRHNADNDGFTCYATANYMDDERLSGDLRVTSSPNPEVTLTVQTPWSKWEKMSATGSYQNDGWDKKEVSSKLDLGQGHVYTLQSSLSGSSSITARLTTPHADWHTLEARASHEGSLQDFKSSAYLSTPLLDAVRASASLSYRSPFDLTAAGSVDTPFDSVKDWKMEVVNGERGSQKTSHVILGWSGDQEIVMDGTWRHDNSWYERQLHTDVSLSTPFQALRRTSWVLEHHGSQDKYEHKMTGSLNGDKLVDLDISTLTGDLPQVTVTLAEPHPMQYSLARTNEGAELGLDWDRNDPNSNLRVTSRFTDSSDSNGLQHDLDLKVVHPSRTVGAKYNLQASSMNAASQGELYWGRGSNRRVFYTLDFNDLSRRSSTSYDGKVKVGVFSRAVQVSGSVTRSAWLRAMDATFHWDADRDQSKQVSLQTKWTPGEKNKADLTLSLPAINQEVRVQSEVAVNQGKTLLDATTALSYSQDSSKVLTFTSKLQDTAGAWDNGSNYTLHLTLTHPHTDLDVSMTSHLGATEDRYSAAVDTWYLTARRQRKNMALRGEIDQLRRQLTVEMVSPVKKMTMKGQVKSVEPYSISLTNSYDDDRVTQSDVTLDTNKRSFSLKTNYDPEHPERSLVLKAFYVNDTAIKAEVYRDHVTDIITDALLALRLNTSTLLHSRLHWRSAFLADLQEYSVAKLSYCASRSKQTLKTVNDAVRDELAARYSRSAAALAEDLTPLMDLLNNEMDELASQLQTLRRQLNRFYRRHPFLKSMGSAVSDRYLALQQYIGEMSDSYQQKVDAISQQMKEAVQTMTQYPVGQYYQQSVNSLLQEFEELIDSGVARLTKAVVSLDSYLLAARQHRIRFSNTVSEAMQNLTQHPYIQSLDVTPYIRAASNKLSALRVPEQYTAVIYDASARANEVLSDVLNMESMKRVKAMSNEVYQQGVWAYNYWQMEENLEKHLHSIATLLKEIIEEELEIYARHFRFLQKSHVTVWDPEHGEIQAEIHLPVAMETLDSMPDMTPLVTKYNEVMNSVPDMDTVQYFYDHYVPKSKWWADNSTDQEQLLAELDEYTPTSKPRLLMKKRNYKLRNRKTVAVM
ncbi:uncharacterized protein LOC143302134 isoform X1 [Babylonia areolata]|uniref:uncharacterized protein LOC143302134 isoform X1 n=1 Tax=Babylonia areolata TaxID=304850 RepID=UPI003FD2C739